MGRRETGEIFTAEIAEDTEAEAEAAEWKRGGLRRNEPGLYGSAQLGGVGGGVVIRDDGHGFRQEGDRSLIPCLFPFSAIGSPGR